MERKAYRVAEEQARIEEQIRRALIRSAPRGVRRLRGVSRTHYDSLEAIIDGEEVVLSRTLRGRIVA